MRDGATRFPTAGIFRHDTCMPIQLKKPNHGLFIHSLHSYARGPRGPRRRFQTGQDKRPVGLNHHLEVRFPARRYTRRMAISTGQRNTKFRDVATSEMRQCRGNYGAIRLHGKFSRRDEFAQQCGMASVGPEAGQKYKNAATPTTCLMKV